MATVLVIDDSDTVRAELTSVLDASGLFDRVLLAGDGIVGLRLLLQESMDAVICDLELPGLDGEKLLRAQRARPEAEDTPFFFVTAERDPDRMARLLRSGAADTITKPFHPAELIARVETHLRLRRLRAELREKNAILEKLSTTDPLTGLRSRRYVRDVLALEVLRAARYRSPLAVVMADLDYFKRVNDTHGHLAGDAVLEATAAVILQRLRATDVAGRFGGEEMILVLPQTDLDGATELAEQLRVAVESNECRFGETRISVTMSLGVAEFGEGHDGDGLVQAADGALYEAKAAGRNRVAQAPPRAGVDTPRGKSRPVAEAGRKR